MFLREATGGGEGVEPSGKCQLQNLFPTFSNCSNSSRAPTSRRKTRGDAKIASAHVGFQSKYARSHDRRNGLALGTRSLTREISFAIHANSDKKFCALVADQLVLQNNTAAGGSVRKARGMGPRSPSSRSNLRLHFLILARFEGLGEGQV
jgi:hypothetical protein